MAEFHYVPTGTGVISGREVLRQTEDAINNALEDGEDTREIAERALATSNTALSNSEQALSTSNQALSTAENALSNSETAVTTANQANTNSQNAIATAQQAVTTSQNAVTAAQAAQTAAEDAASDAADSADIASQAIQAVDASRQAAESAQAAAETAQASAVQSADLATQAQGSANDSARASERSATYAETIAAGVSASARQIGEIITSTLPLSNAGLRLMDGSLVVSDGIYSAFVDYIANLYNTRPRVANVKKVGSLTDTSNVLSGFSASDYAVLPQEVSLGDNFEIQIKVTTGSDVSGNQKVIAASEDNLFVLGLYQSGFDFNIGDGTQWFNPTTLIQSLDANTTYWFKLTFNGARYSLVYSTNGEDFSECAYIDTTYQIPTIALKIGENFYNNSPWLGSIDLNECYINTNGQRYWSGVNPVPFTDEAQWQATVNQYGVCGKFVYDSVNGTVRLPKITGLVEGTTDANALGELVEAGLPNISGTFGVANDMVYNSPSDAIGSGAFGGVNSRRAFSGNASGTSQETAWSGWTFDASISNAIYGNSTTVQPQTLKVLFYIVVATIVKTDIEVDIDNVVTDLNNKLSLTGGTLTGNLNVPSINSQASYNKVYVSQVASGAIEVNTSDGNLFDFTVTGNITFSLAFSGSFDSGAVVTIKLTNGGAYTITWASNIKWEGGVVPFLTANGTDILTFVTIDAGANWYAIPSILGAQ